ncbi:MAG: 2Fe-2S iron-sulfur cluster-binding protein [Gammaproteobacteria bacterium]
MPKVIYLSSAGARREVEVPEGWSVMEGAIQNDVAGIVAECGGGCACGTCHVIVADEWMARLTPPGPHENDMLECTAAAREANSRLSCQIKMSPALDGLAVRTPDRQT